MPKSGDPERIRKNIDIFDFSLTPEEISRLSTLDRGEEDVLNPEELGH